MEIVKFAAQTRNTVQSYTHFADNSEEITTTIPTHYKGIEVTELIRKHSNGSILRIPLKVAPVSGDGSIPLSEATLVFQFL